MNTKINLSKTDVYAIIQSHLLSQGYKLQSLQYDIASYSLHSVNCEVVPIKATKTFIVNIDKKISKAEAEKELKKIMDEYKEVINFDVLLPDTNINERINES